MHASPRRRCRSYRHHHHRGEWRKSYGQPQDEVGEAGGIGIRIIPEDIKLWRNEREGGGWQAVAVVVVGAVKETGGFVVCGGGDVGG